MRVSYAFGDKQNAVPSIERRGVRIVVDHRYGHAGKAFPEPVKRAARFDVAFQASEALRVDDVIDASRLERRHLIEVPDVVDEQLVGIG